MAVSRGILGPHTFGDVPWHTHDFDEISGELVVSEAQITSLSADKITSGIIDATQITLGAGGVIQSSDFVTGPAGAGFRISGGLAELNNVTVRGALITGSGSDVDWTYLSNVSVASADIVSLDADKINAGTLDSGVINTGVLDADNITSGTLSADFIAAGTITADVVITGDLYTSTGGGVSSAGSGTARVGIETDGIVFRDSSNVVQNKLRITGDFAVWDDSVYFTGGLTIGAAAGSYLRFASGISAGQWQWDNTSSGDDDSVSIYYSNSNIGGSPRFVGAWTVWDIDGAADGAAQLVLNAGTSTYPSLSFSGQASSGLYYSSGIRVMHGGVTSATITNTSSGTITTEVVTANNEVQIGNGTAADPSLTFISDGDTGMYLWTANGLAFTTGGTFRMAMDGTRIFNNVQHQMVAGDVSTPGLAFFNDSDTGLYRISSNYFGAAAGGQLMQQWGWSGANKNIYLYGLPSTATNYVRYNGTTGELGYSSSTLEIKKNIRPLDTVGVTDRLRPVRFQYRRDDEIRAKGFRVGEEDWDKEQVGFIAEWTAKELPEAGIYNDGRKRAVNYNPDAVLAATVLDLQDARKRIASLEEKLEAVLAAA